jgi:hypothetical protein
LPNLSLKVEEESVGEVIIEVEKSDIVDLSIDHDSWMLGSCLLTLCWSLIVVLVSCY